MITDTRFVLSESEGLTGLLSEGDVVQRDGLEAHHGQTGAGGEEEERKSQAGSEHDQTTTTSSPSLTEQG